MRQGPGLDAGAAGRRERGRGRDEEIVDDVRSYECELWGGMIAKAVLLFLRVLPWVVIASAC